jgi:uroporphyrinogen decarboxylase
MAEPIVDGETKVHAPFLRACYGLSVPHTPIWLMRQAGRYLPEYRKVREKIDFLTLTRSPEMAAEVTLQPIRRFPLDAAILFSDIMTPLEGMGVDIEFNPGPKVGRPFRTRTDVDRLGTLDPNASVPFVMESIRLVRRELPETVPLIGFAGAPFTLFCYLVAGGPSKEYGEARAFLRAEPEAAQDMLNRLGDAMAAYLAAQAEAGAQVLMLFDSWVGLLARSEFDYFAVPAITRALQPLRAFDIPVIYFANNGAVLYDSIRDLDVDVVGVDWRTPLSVARSALRSGVTLQGNLDPAALFASDDDLRQAVTRVLAEAEGGGHIFNLGHGIWPQTDPDAVARLIGHVHELSAKRE